jgi:hypothetical protein
MIRLFSDNFPDNCTRILLVGIRAVDWPWVWLGTVVEVPAEILSTQEYAHSLGS